MSAPEEFFKDMKDKELTFEEVVCPIMTRDRGQRLVKVRKALNWSQSELGVRLGFEQRMMSRIEQGGADYLSPKLTVALLKEVIGAVGFTYVMFGRRGYQYERPGADQEFRARVKKKGNRTPRSERILSTRWAQEEAHRVGKEHVRRILEERRKKSE